MEAGDSSKMLIATSEHCNPEDYRMEGTGLRRQNKRVFISLNILKRCLGYVIILFELQSTE
jgi:hypothetical protein